MQNGGTYTMVNKKSSWYSDVGNFLREHEHLFKWRPGEKILDVGCGPGDVTANVLLPWLPTDFLLLVGVDISPSVIERAQTSHANDKLSFLVLDVSSDMKDFLQNSEYCYGFDKIFSFYTLHWLQDLRRGIQNLYDLLSPGGQALLIFPIDRHFQKTYNRVGMKEPWSHYFKGAKREIPQFPKGDDPCKEFREMLLDAGFEEIKCELRDLHSFYDSIDLLKGLIESLDPEISRLSVNLKGQYLNDCLQVMEDMKAVAVEGQKITITQKSLISFVTKPVQTSS